MKLHHVAIYFTQTMQCIGSYAPIQRAAPVQSGSINAQHRWQLKSAVALWGGTGTHDDAPCGFHAGNSRKPRDGTPLKDASKPTLPLHPDLQPRDQTPADPRSSFPLKPAGHPADSGSSRGPVDGSVEGPGGWRVLEVPERGKEGGKSGLQSPPLISPQAVAELASTPPCSFPVISASPMTSPCKPYSPEKPAGDHLILYPHMAIKFWIPISYCQP